MSELSKQALRVENNTQFPNNNSGYITPSRLRGFNSDMIDSTVNQAQYEIDSASWNSQINALDPSGSAVSIAALNQFTGSQEQKNAALASQSGSWVTSAITASSLITASFAAQNLTFTKGDGSQFSLFIPDNSGSAGTDITSLNQFTASQESKNATLATYTASVNQQLSSLSSTTASLNTSVTNLNLFTQSADSRLDNIEAATSSYVTSAITGSSLITASFASQNLTFTKGDGTTFSVNIPDNSGSVVDLSSLNAFTASANSRLNNIELATASLQSETQNLELFTASADSRLDNLEAATSSYVTANITGSSLVTASIAGQVITFTKGDSTTFGITLPSGAVPTDISALNAYTASNDIKWSTLGSISGSWITESETGSFARTNVTNTFTADQNFSNNVNIAQNLVVTGDLYVSGSQTIISSSTLIVGDRIIEVNGNRAIGDAGIYAFDAIGDQTGSLIWNPTLNYWLAGLSGSESRIITAADTGSMTVVNALTSSIARNVVVIARNGGSSTLPAGTIVHITSAVGDNPIFTTASYDTEALSSNTFGVLRYSSPAGADVEVVVNGVVTGVNTDPALGYTAGDVLYLSSSGQFTKVQPQAPNQIVTLGQVLRAQQNNGSIYVDINNGWELNELHNVQINNPQTGDLLQYESSSYGLWKNKSISGAGIVSTSSFNAYTSSNDSKVDALIAATASYAISSSVAAVDAAQQSQIDALIAITGSFLTSSTDISSLNAFTASQQLLNTTFATTGSNVFVGNQSLSGSILISGSTLNVISGSADGNVITNLGDTYSELLPVQTIVTITSASYAALVAANETNETTLYIVSGAVDAPNVDLTSLNAFTASQELLNTTFATTGSNQFYGDQYLWDGDGLLQTSFAVNEPLGVLEIGGAPIKPFSGIVIPGDQTQIKLLNTANADYDTNVENIDNVGVRFSPAVATDAIFQLFNHSLDVTNTFTASITEGYVWVGDSTGRTYEVATSSFGTSLDTSSFATTGSNTFTGTQFIVSSSFSGSLISNLTDIYTDIPAVDRIVTLTSASYAALLSGSLTDANTLYVISGSITSGGGGTIDTGSFATTGSNNFYGDQFIWDATGVTNAQFAVTDSPALLSISNKRVNTADGIQIPGGQVQIILKNDGNTDYDTNIENVDNVGVRFQPAVATDAIMELSGYSLNVANKFTASITEGYIWVGDSAGRTYEFSTSSLVGGGTDITALNAFTASQQALNSTFATTGSNTFYGVQNIVSSSFSGSLISNLTDIYTDIPAANRIVTLTSASYAALLTGSLTDPNTLYVISGSITSGGGTNITSLNAFTASQELLNTTFATTGSNSFIGEQSISENLIITGSLTASLSDGYVWVGDVSGKTYEVPTSSFAGLAPVGVATTGSNEFQASQVITGSLTLVSTDGVSFSSTITPDDTISRLTFSSAIKPFGIDIPDGEAIVFIDAIDTDWNARISQIDGEGLKITNVGNIQGPTLRLDNYNLVITGSARGLVTDVEIASSTASMNLAVGNYFTLTLAASATTHIEATNIQPGQTVTLLVNTDTSSSVLFAPTILQPSGSTYTPSASGSKDIISLVAFDDTTLYAVSTKNLV